MMLVVNKLAMRSFPIPAMVTLAQLISCTIFVYFIGALGVKIDHLTKANCKGYAIYCGAFAAGIYSNMRALAGTNVETIIVFRACTPITVCVIEWFFMGRELPSTRSFASLVTIMGGAAAYVMLDSEMKAADFATFFWIASWYSLLCFQMTYGKILLTDIKTETIWGPVLYSNCLSIPFTMALGACLGDFNKYDPSLLQDHAGLWVGLSCVVGIGIGYAGWACRDMISATSYTLVGVLNKLISVGLSVTFINKSASAASLLALLVCLLAGTQYKQPPMRNSGQDSKV
jgi:GDP-mannose transporter